MQKYSGCSIPVVRALRVREDRVRFSAARPFDKLRVFDRERRRRALSLSKGCFFMKYYLYILRGPNNHLYVGVTSNLINRIIRHSSGDGAEFTFRNKTYNIVYTEEYQTLLEARRRESQIKKWRREKKENLIRFGKPIIQ